MGERTSRYFTLAGFMVEADQILEIEKKVKKIKKKYLLAEEHELKWHTTYSKLGLNFQQYKNIKLEIIQVIAQYKGSVIGIIMDKQSCYQKKEYIKTPKDMYAVALHLLMERISMETNQPTMLIADSRRSKNNNRLDNELKVAYVRAKNMGTYFRQFPNFYESMMFGNSDDFSGIQLADFCAGAIHKKYERGDTEFFEQLLPAIVCKKNNIYGPGVKFYQ